MSLKSRSPHGERGLKSRQTQGRFMGRSPHGERGLKYVGKLHGLLVAEVALLMESVD